MGVATKKLGLVRLLLAVVPTSVITGCSSALPWPDSPLYAEQVEHERDLTSVEQVKNALVGHYAHYDVVAYEDTELDAEAPMRSFVITYGFTDFAIDNGELVQTDRFCRAEHSLNQKYVTTTFSDAATQAISARSQPVSVFQAADGQWHVNRIATPTLIGIHGDPNLPLSFEAEGDALHDADNDGKPGVTVELRVAKLFKGEIYLARREVFNYFMTLKNDGRLQGYVEDRSEQRVIDATWKILQRQSNPPQYPDKGLNPVELVPIADEIQRCDDLMALRDQLFPPAPAFY